MASYIVANKVQWKQNGDFVVKEKPTKYVWLIFLALCKDFTKSCFFKNSPDSTSFE